MRAENGEIGAAPLRCVPCSPCHHPCTFANFCNNCGGIGKILVVVVGGSANASSQSVSSLDGQVGPICKGAEKEKEEKSFGIATDTFPAPPTSAVSSVPCKTARKSHVIFDSVG